MSTNKRVLMCPPTYFDISYEINPWMDLNNQVQATVAKEQWQELYDTYCHKLGWQVDLIEPQANLPDMVFTANGGLLIGKQAMVANFRHPDRQPETDFFKQCFQSLGFNKVEQPRYNFEGEGDGLLWGDCLLLGYPWRSDYAAHQAVASYFDKEVLSLQLIDARFYHLDTCLTPIDHQTVAIYPPAFSQASLGMLRQRVKNLIEAETTDALAYGLNACVHQDCIVIPESAHGLIDVYQKMGFKVFPVPMSEFKKSGGGVKCLTLELH